VSDVLKTLAAVLLWHDPMGLARYQQADEYQGEAELLYHHLAKAGQNADVVLVQRWVHSIFQQQFDPLTAGPPERYGAVAVDVTSAWKIFCTERS
jgi:hypothetical protein